MKYEATKDVAIMDLGAEAKDRFAFIIDDKGCCDLDMEHFRDEEDAEYCPINTVSDHGLLLLEDVHKKGKAGVFKFSELKKRKKRTFDEDNTVVIFKNEVFNEPLTERQKLMVEHGFLEKI